jgi:hypothetical protein
MVQITIDEELDYMLARLKALFFNRAARALMLIPVAFVVAAGQIEFDRPKTDRRLPNPSMIAASRDEVLTVIKQMLETREIAIEKEDCNATSGECTLVSKPVVFIKGITTKSQLEHYSEVPTADLRNWIRGRYTLRVQIGPASPKTAQVGVYARFEGMTDGVIGSDWVPLASRGELEDKMLKCIQDRVVGGDCKDIFK